MLYDDGRNVRLLYELEVPVYPQEAQEQLGIYKTGDYSLQARVSFCIPGLAFPGPALLDPARGCTWTSVSCSSSGPISGAWWRQSCRSQTNAAMLCWTGLSYLCPFLPPAALRSILTFFN